MSKKTVFFLVITPNHFFDSLVQAQQYKGDDIYFICPLDRGAFKPEHEQKLTSMGITGILMPKLNQDMNKIHQWWQTSPLPTPDILFFTSLFGENRVNMSTYFFYEDNPNVSLFILDEGTGSYTLKNLYEKTYIYSAHFYNGRAINWGRFEALFLYAPELSEDKNILKIEKINTEGLWHNAPFIAQIREFYDLQTISAPSESVLFLDQYLVYGDLVMPRLFSDFFMQQLSTVFKNDLIVKFHPVEYHLNKYKNLPIKTLENNAPWQAYYLTKMMQDVDSPRIFITFTSSALLRMLTAFTPPAHHHYIFLHNILKEYLLSGNIFEEPINRVLEHNPAPNVHSPATWQELFALVEQLQDKEGISSTQLLEQERNLLLAEVRRNYSPELLWAYTSIEGIFATGATFQNWDSFFMYADAATFDRSVVLSEGDMVTSLTLHPVMLRFRTEVSIEKIMLLLANGEELLVTPEMIAEHSGRWEDNQLIKNPHHFFIKIQLSEPLAVKGVRMVGQLSIDTSLKGYSDFLIGQVNDLNGQVNDLNGQVNDLNGQVNDLNGQVNDLNSQNAQLNLNISQLDAQKQTLQQNKWYRFGRLSRKQKIKTIIKGIFKKIKLRK